MCKENQRNQRVQKRSKYCWRKIKGILRSAEVKDLMTASVKKYFNHLLGKHPDAIETGGPTSNLREFYTNLKRRKFMKQTVVTIQ